ncbi:matrix metalloproteinase-21-like [Limulus polyphemus]|uniref:Matrix metalloproteinase-14 n=1 Tax=Limulus polyphemus TaxID=6850 RepID=A0ABM1SFD9_LIMPO|nr:matrix metalloproteinase-21-like [Limulus polyphemus]XP_022242341.1 matrix metalloproteinase-21-like [Limulus polyphemus]XP_022242343.1 matrix metalloproteinase-21-like [Limulus polyphemus]XP_022242344.1 matrix metalloproteinase-21-like [Limulus polyphemus]
MEKNIFRWLDFVVLLFILSSGGGQNVLHFRDMPDSLRYNVVNDRNLVTTEKKAEEVLSRYGYLRCGSREKRDVVFRFGEVSEALAEETHSSQTCSETDIEEAIRRYQRTYNMPETGRLDAETMRVMSESRCGNADDESAAVPFKSLDIRKDLYSILTPPISRNKREIVQDSSLRDQILDEIGLAPQAEPQALIPTAPGTTVSRRRRWLKKYIKQIENGELDRKEDEDFQKNIQQRRRKKRSTVTGLKNQAFTTIVVRWRLIRSATSRQLPVTKQRAALALAFRMWSEVIPLLFREDNKSPVNDVDILIAFGKRDHLNCPNHFDGAGGQLSHAIKLKTNAEIHVDDDEHLTVGSDHGTNLVKVSVHEIGHALGLLHTNLSYSIMYAIYSQIIPNNNFELGWEDRKLVQKIYGDCDGRFDTVFDWVRRRDDGELIYNTFFFRNDHYWMYENRYNRTRYGDPRNIKPEWKSLPDKIDAYVHVWTYTKNEAYFFKGPYYYKYDNGKHSVIEGYPKSIKANFRSIQGSRFPNIPGNIDSVFFDQRDGNLYFFKGKFVYAYDVNRGNEGCCLPGYPKEITKEFPAKSHESSLPDNLDAVYYSYTHHSMFFFKGNQFWKNLAFQPLGRERLNEIAGPWPISSKWYDICEVDL